MNWRRATQISLGLAVLVMAAVSVVAASLVVPASGVVPENVGGQVQYVEPGSPAWRDGIRPGDLVIKLDRSGDDWTIGTMRDGDERESTKSGQIARLRAWLPWSIVVLLLAGLAALLAYRGHRAAAVLLPLTLLAAALPLFVAGSLAGSLAAGSFLFAGAALAAVAFAPWRRGFVIPIAFGCALAVSWVVSILTFPDAFDAVDGARAPVAAGFSVLGFAVVTDRRRIVEFLTGPSGPAFVDLIYLGLAVAILIAGFIADLPVLAAIVTVAALLAYPFWRRATLASLESLVTSQARREASIRAVEDERGRLAREIHDSPLQDLSGVIRRLEALPGAEHEADALRVVAGHLRDVATTLHPPVLVDLGLPAAIEDLRDQLCASSPAWRITVDVDDLTTAARPPAEVELAAFRVTQEAMANAVAHSGGHCLGVRGSVAPEVIDLAISDDGHGLREQDARAARRAGHFGLDSIRERATAAGGTSVLTSTPQGLCVRFRWESRS